MASIGTTTVKVVPDLSDFTAMMEAALAADGLVIREEISYERDATGQVTKQTKVTSIGRQA